jgi:hypothetical protein
LTGVADEDVSHATTRRHSTWVGLCPASTAAARYRVGRRRTANRVRDLPKRFNFEPTTILGASSSLVASVRRGTKIMRLDVRNTKRAARRSVPHAG